MAKRRVNEDLLKLLEKRDLDGLIYDLTEIAYQKRDDQDDLGKEMNRAERNYWQKVGGILANLQEELENL